MRILYKCRSPNRIKIREFGFTSFRATRTKLHISVNLNG